MLKISDVVSNVKVYGLDESVTASEYPMATDITKCTPEITETTKRLARCTTGTGHDQFLTGIVVQFDLTLTNKAWVEAQRYHFLDFVSSQSTMHKAAKFDIGKQCIGYVKQQTIDLCEELAREYNFSPNPERYLTLLYKLPMGFRLTARMTTNYRQLKTIYQQRKTHRLPEWKVFCTWIESLPESELITSGSVSE